MIGLLSRYYVVAAIVLAGWVPIEELRALTDNIAGGKLDPLPEREGVS